MNDPDVYVVYVAWQSPPSGAVVYCKYTRYTGVVISSFQHKGLALFYSTGSKKGIQAAHEDKLRRILGVLDVAQTIRDVDIPSFRTHQLSGKSVGDFSIWVSGNWRVTFQFDGVGVELVDYLDYY